MFPFDSEANQQVVSIFQIKDAIRREYSLERQREYEEENETNKHIIYRIGRNTLFTRIYPQTMNKWRHHK